MGHGAIYHDNRVEVEHAPRRNSRFAQQSVALTD